MWFLNRLNGSDCWPTAKEGHASMMMKPTAANPGKRLNTVHLRSVLSQSTSARDLSEPKGAIPRLDDARCPRVPSWRPRICEIAAMPRLKACDRERPRLATIPAEAGTFYWHPNVARLFRNQAHGGRAAAPLRGYARQTVGQAG